MSKVQNIKRIIFLKDVLVVALSAYGGPNMHLALYNKRLVEEKKYLSTEELLEIYSLCQMLPGPSSTQTLVSIGYKFGGPFLAFLTLLVWVLPAAIILSVLALFIGTFDEGLLNYLRFVQPVAIAFVLVAGIKMFSKSVHTKLDYVLAIFAFALAALARHPLEEYVKTPWIFPFVLLVGGVVSYLFTSRKPQPYEPIKIKIPWRYLVFFLAFFAIAAFFAKLSSDPLVILFENNYRFGSLVFGGGNVLIPMMYEQFVNYTGTISSDEFITGIGLVQAVPGPIFTIASYTGGLAVRGGGVMQQILGSGIGTVGIFLPGALLIFFIYPIWRQIKTHPLVVRALPGVIAASAGLVIAAAYLMFLPVGLNWIETGNFYYTNLDTLNPINFAEIGIIAITGVFLFTTKIASPWYIVVALLAGIIF
ncbi:chromate transporter [bacterium]|nr:chromate transporter [bacterium]